MFSSTLRCFRQYPAPYVCVNSSPTAIARVALALPLNTATLFFRLVWRSFIFCSWLRPAVVGLQFDPTGQIKPTKVLPPRGGAPGIAVQACPLFKKVIGCPNRYPTVAAFARGIARKRPSSACSMVDGPIQNLSKKRRGACGGGGVRRRVWPQRLDLADYYGREDARVGSWAFLS